VDGQTRLYLRGKGCTDDEISEAFYRVEICYDGPQGIDDWPTEFQTEMATERELQTEAEFQSEPEISPDLPSPPEVSPAVDVRVKPPAQVAAEAAVVAAPVIEAEVAAAVPVPTPEPSPPAAPVASVPAPDPEPPFNPPSMGKLDIEVSKAIKLKQIQRIQGEDPYAMAEVLPDTIGGGMRACTLPDVDAGPAPVWTRRHKNILSVMVPSKELVSEASLQLSVMNAKAPRVDQPMGIVSMPLAALIEECTRRGSAENKTSKESQLTLDEERAGELQYKVQFLRSQGELRVTVKEAAALSKAGVSQDLCNPYCLLSLDGLSVQTAVKPHTFEPKWEQHFDLVSVNLQTSLRCELLSKTEGSGADKPLGEISISLTEIAEAGTMDDQFQIGPCEVKLRLQWNGAK